jgi:hypothetical protein
MNKFFITGPCHPNKHYMLPAQERCRGLLDLIDQKLYTGAVSALGGAGGDAQYP